MNFYCNHLVSTFRLMTLLMVLALVTQASARHSPPRDYTIDWPIKSYRSGTKLFDPRAYYASLSQVTKRTAVPLYLPGKEDAKSWREGWRELQQQDNDIGKASEDQQLQPFSSFITLVL